jgi:Leucine-rich repeat (LRR) protein
MPNLQSLYCSGNLLTSLPRDLFSGNPQLEIIWLQDNKLNAIYQTTFSNLKKLNSLWLKNNTCIDKNFSAPRNGTFNSTAVMGALIKCDANANTAL